jgi:acyl-CoA thioester hydrolase
MLFHYLCGSLLKQWTMNQDKYIFTLEIAVRDYELDSEGIVNNAIYLHYLEHTRHAFVKQEGIPFGSLTREGLVPVVRRMEIDYRTPLRSGDVMVSRLWIEREGPRFIFHQDIFRKDGGEAVLSAVVTIVCMENGRINRGDDLAARIAKYLDRS